MTAKQPVTREEVEYALVRLETGEHDPIRLMCIRDIRRYLQEQDATLERIDKKLDLLLKRLPSVPE